MRTEMFAVRHPALRILALAALLAVPTASLGSPAQARADERDGNRLTVTPASASPDARVDLRLRGCGDPDGKAVAEVFRAAVHLTRHGGLLAGTARIAPGARPGSYPVTVHCDGHQATVHDAVRIVAAPRGTTGRSPAKPPPPGAARRTPALPARPSARARPPAARARPSGHPRAPERPEEPGRARPPASPVAPVRAGGGGAPPPSAAMASPGTRHTLLGLGLAGIAAVAVAVRSVRRRRPEAE